ncbi:hypothetical protein HZC09_06615 [Candidatus Micrarchaeota archaeon]|nr:hypothetical protein [Candidatus Micrarchaeota archaeon]
MDTPYLKLPLDSKIWVRKDEGWFTLDGAHQLFGEGRPYNGVLHAEILPSETTTVLNLGIDTSEGAQVFSFSFPKKDSSLKTFKDQNLSESYEKKALKIASELLNHLEESPQKRGLLERIGSRVSELEMLGNQGVWERF